MVVDMSTTRMPSAYISHGGGPCFFMEWNPRNEWDALRAALEGIGPSLGRTPSAIVVVSAHWETPVFAVNANPRPGLIYDYTGFPAHTYQLSYPAPGEPSLAARISELLAGAGLAHQIDPTYGWDHGVFIPLKVMYPDAEVPIVAMSVRRDFDPEAHLELGRALAPLRDEGVLIVGSGFSFHHFGNFGRQDYAVPFDDWLNEAMVQPAAERWHRLANWTEAPYARQAHAREEHLLPLMVAAGAADDVPARNIFRDSVMGTKCSCWLFD